MKYVLVVMTFFAQSFLLMAQQKVWVGKADKILNFQFHYTYTEAGGDFSSRFNTFNGLGFGVILKTRHNVLLSFDGAYYFGNDIKQNNVLFNLTNSSSYINNASGYPAEFNLGMRGFSVMGRAGYLFPISARNRNSGIALMFGGGLVQHKLHIAVNREDIPALTEEKKAGYDRYSSGFGLTQFVGYFHQSRNRRINFYAGADLIQAFTYNRRKFNYDEMRYDTELHQDQYLSIKLGWMIPMYLKAGEESDEFYFE